MARGGTTPTTPAAADAAGDQESAAVPESRRSALRALEVMHARGHLDDATFAARRAAILAQWADAEALDDGRQAALGAGGQPNP